jgi:hypothetical protein
VAVVEISQDSVSLFWDIVLPERSDKGCWLFPNTYRGGYGGFSYYGEQERAHRFAYRSFKGDIPKEMRVLRKCDVRNCVNPDHLFLGDRNANNKDRATKGRSATGELSGRWKLTDAQVKKIRKNYKNWKGFRQQKAKEFGVNRRTLYRIGITGSRT